MIGFKIMDAKQLFFTAKKVIDATTEATRRNLSKFGAFVWRRSRSSIKYSEKPSPAGSPPHGHRSMMRTKKNRRTGEEKKQSVSPLREFIYFVFEPTAQSVIIGPAKLNSKKGDAPRALEEGGESTILSSVWTGKGKDRHRERVEKTVTVSAHPYMKPAFDKELEKLDPLWRNSVRA